MSQVLDPSLVSPSRLGCYAECGLRFRMQYVDGIKPRAASGASLYGNVIHHARDQWVLSRRKLDFVQLVEEAWDHYGREDPGVGYVLARYRQLQEQAKAKIAEILADNPKLKAPRQTKAWKESDIAREIGALLTSTADEFGDDTYYQFSATDPLPVLYDESFRRAAEYQSRWRWLPDALYSEVGFNVDWKGFRLRGRIDDISPIIHPDTGEFAGIGLVDCKTEKSESLSQKHLNQLVMYRIALRELIERGVVAIDPLAPVFIGVDLFRLGIYRWFNVTELDEQRLLNELKQYRRAVVEQVFLPAAKSRSCDLCDYQAECSEYHGAARALDLEQWYGCAA